MAAIAIIGAGLSGLVAARELTEQHNVTVFEKSRGVGGRMATRYADGLEFDHGTQFFIAKTPEFQSFLQPLIEQGVVANWPARFAELDRNNIIATRQWEDKSPHYVGTPRMNSIGNWLSTNVDIRLRSTVARIQRTGEGDGWTLIDNNEAQLGQFDWVICSMPAPQTAALPPASSDIQALAAARHMRGCFALMLAFDRPPGFEWQAALVSHADISWVSVNSSKPGRADAHCIVVHSTNAWADAHIDDDPESIKKHMLAEFYDVSGDRINKAKYCNLHRWLYANIDAQKNPGYYIDARQQIAACGDWFIHGRVEAAFTSGHALAGALQLCL